jgi:hypothetical protein
VGSAVSDDVAGICEMERDPYNSSIKKSKKSVKKN